MALAVIVRVHGRDMRMRGLILANKPLFAFV
jgi:hypothetical protein